MPFHLLVTHAIGYFENMESENLPSMTNSANSNSNKIQTVTRGAQLSDLQKSKRELSGITGDG